MPATADRKAVMAAAFSEPRGWTYDQGSFAGVLSRFSDCIHFFL
jgi:hypothetical protein